MHTTSCRGAVVDVVRVNWMRVIYIAGTDFCGSTLLDRLFWLVPGVVAPGELHWLLDAPATGARPTRAGWQVSRLCTRHGAACTALPKSFVERSFEPATLYSEVAAQLGADVLVSADKGSRHCQRLAAHWQPAVVVLYKSPRAQTASFQHNERRPPVEGLGIWRETYSLLLDSHPDAVSIAYEALAAYPNEVMSHLCETMGLHPWQRVDASSVLQGQDYHHVGGNPRTHQDRPIALREALDGDSDPESEELLCELRHRSFSPAGSQ